MSEGTYKGKYTFYKTLFEKEIERKDVEKILGSQSSYQIKHDENGECKALINRFVIKNESLFCQKFKEAISGDGKEKKHICRLNSSSLLALLFFYSVSEDQPLELSTKDGKKYKFVNSYFEVQTEVTPQKKSDNFSHYSNIDVVLSTKDRQTLLFLESKFSEYLGSGKKIEISYDAYKDYYKDLGKIGCLSFNVDDEKKTISICTEKKGYYINGIKQMISHYIGIKRFIEGKTKANYCVDIKTNKRVNIDIPNKIILGEILFSFNDENKKGRNKNYKDKFRKYVKIYDVINTVIEKNPIIDTSIEFELLPGILTYQSENLHDWRSKIEDEVLKFYGFK